MTRNSTNRALVALPICPPWCAQIPIDHQPMHDADGSVAIQHSATLFMLGRISIVMEAANVVLADGTANLSTPALVLYSTGGDKLTATDARALATELAAAADQLDKA
ncbi:hypothetical protein ACSMXN_20805 [Jatrophihabitans sp. DSM 45814]